MKSFSYVFAEPVNKLRTVGDFTGKYVCIKFNYVYFINIWSRQGLNVWTSLIANISQPLLKSQHARSFEAEAAFFSFRRNSLKAWNVYREECSKFQI